MSGIEKTISGSKKHEAVRLLDSNCIDYESYVDSDGNLVVTIIDDVPENILDRLDEINVG